MRLTALAAAGLLAIGCGGERPASPADAERCLRNAEFLVMGPLLREADDTDAPDQTLMVKSRDRGSVAYLGWYDDEARADRSAPEQVEHAEEFEGTVDRHGAMTIIWVAGKDRPEGARIRGCALH